MLDFAKLRARTSAEREADDLQRLAEEIALDRARRRERSEKSVALTLTVDAELRYTIIGTGVIHLRGSDERARTMAAIWYMPDDFERPRVRDTFNRLREGTAVRLEATGALEVSTEKRFSNSSRNVSPSARRHASRDHGRPEPSGRRLSRRMPYDRLPFRMGLQTDVRDRSPP